MKICHHQVIIVIDGELLMFSPVVGNTSDDKQKADNYLNPYLSIN